MNSNKKYINSSGNEVIVPSELVPEFEKVRAEIGDDEFFEKISYRFGNPVIAFARSLVINLPGDCYANCWYCIDASLRRSTISESEFLEVVDKTIKEFPEIVEVAITGGTLGKDNFLKLIKMLKSAYPDARLTWNTNGPNIDGSYKEAVDQIDYVNLHRNAIDEDENFEIFRSTAPIISIEDAKELFGDKLFLRVTIDKSFNLDEWAALGVPLYLNQLLPSRGKNKERYEEVLAQLDFNRKSDLRRHNEYKNLSYNGLPVRVCVGDTLNKRKKGRYPVCLNVVIVHRNGKVGGTWFYDDKNLM
jgi:hypothetical protein